MTDWNAALYMKFEKERSRGARDLLVQIPHFKPRSVFDLGCGPGNSTELLATAFPTATIVGIDLSENMLAVARGRVVTAKFIKEDIDNWRPQKKVDLIFANAALHLVPDHHELMARLVSFLNVGGWLAVQMPNNIHEPWHALMRMAAADGPWASRLVPIAKTRAMIGPLEEYYELLTSLCSKLDIWQTTYIHPLEGPDGIVEWFEGAELQPFLAPLSPSERTAFLTSYRTGLVAAYPKQSNGKVLLRHPRLFFVAQR